MSRLLSYGFLLVMLMFGLTASAQLVVDDTYTPQQLVEDVLIGGGVQVSNFEFSGNAQARGYFDGTNSNIGLESGIIISTGRVADAPGPNGTPISDVGTEFNGAGDSELTAISGSPLGTYDAAFIEFDFVPSSDTVQFNYVFASNEYMLYVGTGVNDVFAFFISGPGIVGEENVALIPGTTTPVTIDNVNANTNAQFYVDNENPPGSTVEYNGFTQVLTATAVLTPCESYHIRLAIADGGDESFDSAVFLEAGSFTSPSVSLNAESSFSTSSSDQELVEGCSSMTLTFERSAPLDDPLSVGLTVSGSASVGADISNIPTMINFPAGSATATLSFNVLEDGLIEGVEDMTITLDQLNPCSTGPPTSVSFTIQDIQPIALTMTPDVTFVCPEEYDITVVPSGGYPDYQYNWTGSTETDESITVFPISSTTYNVTVSDECGQSATASTTVLIPDYEPLEVAVEDVIVCNGDDATLTSVVSGGLGVIAYSWDGGGSDPSYTFAPQSTTTVTLEVTDDCNLSESAIATVTVDEVQASFTHRLTGHASVQFTSTTVNVYDFMWDFGDGTGSTRESPEHDYAEEGTYWVTLTVVNANGCETVLEDSVTVYPPLHVYIPNAFTPNGDGTNEVFGMVGEGYLYYDLEIFDRWGNMIMSGRFENEVAWDGTYKGNLVPSDQYIYRIYVQPPIGIEFKEAGALQVLSGID